MGIAFGISVLLILGLSGCFLLKNSNKAPDAAMVIDAFYECRNLEYVKELVEEGQVDVNGLVPFGSFFPKKVSPLYLMQRFRSDMRFIDYLLKKGADPDVAFGDTTPLMCALGADKSYEAGYEPKLVESLLKYGADVNRKDKKKMTALDYALQHGFADAVKMILEYKPKLTQKNLKMAYKSAHERGGYAAVKWVFEAAKKEGLTYEDGPEIEAAILGDGEGMIKAIHEKEGEYAPETPYLGAAFCTSGAIAYFIDRGFDLEPEEDENKSLLWIAASEGNLDVVRYLVGKNVSLDFGEYKEYEEDPLKASVIRNHYSVAKYLLESGAKFNINAETGFDGDYYVGEEPYDSMQGAVANGNKEMLSLMKTNGYPFNHITYARGLEMAVKSNRLDMAQYLMDNGADPNIAPEYFAFGKSIMEVCALYGTVEMVRLFAKYGASIEKKETAALKIAADKGKGAMVRYFLDQGMEVDSLRVNKDGSRSDIAWITVDFHGYFDVIKALVEHGADVNDPEVYYLIQNGGESHRILKYLLEHGAKVNQKTEEGNTALIIAANYGKVKNVEILLQAGADPAMKNKEGETALSMAQKRGHKDVVKLLKRYE